MVSDERFVAATYKNDQCQAVKQATEDGRAEQVLGCDAQLAQWQLQSPVCPPIQNNNRGKELP